MPRDDLFIEPASLLTPEGLREAGLVHNPVTALVVPRPIAWISTVSAQGVVNLAPFSFSGMASQSPPTVFFCPNASHAAGGDKDSLANVRDSGEFVFNLATLDLCRAMNQSSDTVARDVDEFDLIGLEKATCRLVKPPRVAAAPIALECRVLKIVDLSEGSGQRNTAVFGRVIGIHIDRSIIRDGVVDVMSTHPVARLGYLDYATCGPAFQMERPGATTTVPAGR
jgi:flavin reductase (DIM6/NTAB) family NADH-FMN oxidoreductase RutF